MSGVGPRLGGAGHVLERNLRVYRRLWMIVVSGGFEPVLYLLAMGVGLGGLVGDVEVAGTQVGYAAFVAPALLASAAMNGAVLEGTNLFFRVRYGRVYVALLATPLTPAGVAVGEMAFGQLRGLLYAVAFLGVAGAFGLVSWPLGVLAVGAAVLIGFAFAAVGVVVATVLRGYTDLEYVQLALLPVFLLSATFFPLDVYPEAVRPLVQLSPLYHGTALVRGLMLGVITPGAAALHCAVLLAVAGVGSVVATRRLAVMLAR